MAIVSRLTRPNYFPVLPICDERPVQEPDTATKISGGGAGAGLVPQHPICYMAAIIGTAGPRPSRSSPHAVVAGIGEAPTLRGSGGNRGGFEPLHPHQPLNFCFKIRKLLQHTDIWTARSTEGQYRCCFA